MPYVVTEPESLRGVYESWADLPPVRAWLSGVRCQKIENAEEAKAILASTGVVLAPGLYSFTDGNRAGGVGVAVVRVDNEDIEPQVVQRIATTVAETFQGAAISGMEAVRGIAEALGRLHPTLEELAGLYVALREAPEGAEMTIVYDYAGVGAFMRDQWKAKDTIVKAVISASRELAAGKRLQLRYYHQPGHPLTIPGRNDLVRFNALAHDLAAHGSNAVAPE
jgi:hypothetical protein